MKKILFLAFMLLAPVASAYEEVCGDSCWDRKDMIPSCEDLGYTQDRYCPEGYITCPFDETYVWCKTYTCDMSGLLTKAQADVQKAKGYLCYKSKFHGLVCYDCDEIDKTICVYDETNKGEGRLSGTKCGDGSWTECIRTCADKDMSASIPTVAGVIPTYRICMSCGVEETIVTGFTCAENYTKENNTCKPNDCQQPTSYTNILYTASNATDCSAMPRPEGWIFETKGKSGDMNCSRCIPKDCPLGYTPKLESCPNTLGYVYESQGYSGEDVCGYCRGLNCLSPYNEKYQTINDCAALSNSDWSVAKAWNYSQDTIMAGDKACGLCEPKACVGDYSQNYQSINDCPNTSGYTWEYDKDHFYGDKYCGRCVAKTCSAGGAPGLTVDQCVSSYGYSSTIGAGIVATNEYVGMEQCKTCTCDTSKLCLWTAENIGDGGEGNTVCCDGTSYTKCQKKASCDGVEASSIAHATSTSSCSACGHTYLKATDCEEGYKVSSDGKSCVQKLCADFGLVSQSECSSSQGYYATPSAEHPGCYTCTARTCDLWGDAWELYTNGATCPEGYDLTDHEVMISGAPATCYDCKTCSQASGYLTVNSLSDIPSTVVERTTIKSCEKYQYCATSCSEGYTVSGCACVEANCNGFSQESGLTKINDTLYTDGIFNYSTCRKGGEILYKVNGCATGYEDINACAQIGQARVGSEKGGYACYRCDCTNVNATTCPWNSSNIGNGGAGVNACCDGTSYQGCSRDTDKCNYTLTSEPEKASLTTSCSACGSTYYKVEACQTGYKGDTCSDCDTDNGYDLCNGDCRKKLSCEHGSLKCGSEWYCQCETGWAGSLCNECDAGYQACGDTCQQSMPCVNGVSKCGDDGNLKCECSTGYAGTYCSICAEGYEDYGNGCVLVEGCGNGTFNGTGCDCDQCYDLDASGKCTVVKEGCATNPVRPRTCATELLEDSCDESCNHCAKQQIITLEGTKDCYSPSPKTCSDFCAFWDTSSHTGSIQANSVCGSASTVLAYSYGTYSWLTSTSSSATISVCGSTCYFNDTICSEGEKLSATEKAQREAAGDVCSASGMTAAGSPCYSCTSDACPFGLVNEKDVPDKEANGYICTLKQGSTSPAGSACYKCLQDICEATAAYSSESLSDRFYQYGYKNDSTPYTINDTNYTGYALTGVGNYCYTGLTPSCSSVTSNTLYNTASDCIEAIKYHKNTSGKMLAACHACATSSSPKMVRWYPACLSGYDTQPSSAGMNYQNGNNCCIEDYETVGGNITVPVYEWKSLTLLEYDLGGQTCYSVSGQCAQELAPSGYCDGSACFEVTCPANYKWTPSNVPDHAYVSGESCKNVSANCSESEAKYASFECDTGYSKVGDACAIVCDESQGYYAQCPDGATCVDSGLTGCVKFAQCNGSEGYYAPTFTSPYFTFGDPISYHQLGGAIAQCKKATGCASPASANRSDFNETYYNVQQIIAGNVTCYYTNGCANGYCGSTCSTYIKSCDGYPYSNSNHPDHSTPSGDECIPINSSNCTEEEKKYKDFTCDSSSGYTKYNGGCCLPSCPSGWYTLADRPALSHSCESYTSESKSNGCGGTLTCYKIDRSGCKTDCEDYGYSPFGVTSTSCTISTIVNDLGETIHCITETGRECSPDQTCSTHTYWSNTQSSQYSVPVYDCCLGTCYCDPQSCEEKGMKSSRTGNYQTLYAANDMCGSTINCYCSKACTDHGLHNYSSTYKIPVTRSFCGSSVTCYQSCEEAGASSTQTSTYNTPVTNNGVTCYVKGSGSGSSSSGGGGGGGDACSGAIISSDCMTCGIWDWVGGGC